MADIKKYQDIFYECFAYAPMKPRYWQRYKDRWWRLCGTYSYKGRREEILALYKKRRKNIRTKVIVDMFTRPSPIFAFLESVEPISLEPVSFPTQGLDEIVKQVVREKLNANS